MLMLCIASDVCSRGLCQDLLASSVEGLPLGYTQIEKLFICACACVCLYLSRRLRSKTMIAEADRARIYPEALVCQDDGAVVMAVAYDSPHGLIDCPGGLLRIPLLPR